MILHYVKCNRKNYPVLLSMGKRVVTGWGHRGLWGASEMGVFTMNFHKAIYLGLMHRSVFVINFNKKF